jgi:hypothetical protein
VAEKVGLVEKTGQPADIAATCRVASALERIAEALETIATQPKNKEE